VQPGLATTRLAGALLAALRKRMERLRAAAVAAEAAAAAAAAAGKPVQPPSRALQVLSTELSQVTMLLTGMVLDG
jgi:hypothetical protein